MLVILAPQNDDWTFINTDILNQISGEPRIFYNYNKIICDDDNKINNYPEKFLNFLTVSGLPPYKLVWKLIDTFYWSEIQIQRKHLSMEQECMS